MNIEKSKKIFIIGAGLAGATIARIMADKNYHVSIFEKRGYVGGNCFDTYTKYGVLYHKYGPHIFHTDDKFVVDFVNKFAVFNNYTHNVVAQVDKRMVGLPINFQVIKSLYPQKGCLIISRLKKQFKNCAKVSIREILNCQDTILKEPFLWIFNEVYKPYTQKMWGKSAAFISDSVINRVSVWLTDECSYFPTAVFQGLPVGGYTKMITNMLDNKNITVHLNFDACNFLSLRNGQIFWEEQQISFPVIYCGSIDQLFNYQFGFLSYRSLEFQWKNYQKNFVQKYSVINYPKHPTITRSVEYKHLTKQKDCDGFTVVSNEIPGEYNPWGSNWNQPYYPLPTAADKSSYDKYAKLASEYKNLYLLGRLAEYRYYDMDDVIKRAFCLSQKLAL